MKVRINQVKKTICFSYKCQKYPSKGDSPKGIFQSKINYVMKKNIANLSSSNEKWFFFFFFFFFNEFKTNFCVDDQCHFQSNFRKKTSSTCALVDLFSLIDRSNDFNPHVRSAQKKDRKSFHFIQIIQ